MFDHVIDLKTFTPLSLYPSMFFVQFCFFLFLMHSGPRYPSLLSFFLAQNPDPSKMDKLLKLNRRIEVLEAANCFKFKFSLIKLAIHVETNDIRLLTTSYRTLNFAFWSCFQNIKSKHSQNCEFSYVQLLNTAHWW